jgi:hypothetical protein
MSVAMNREDRLADLPERWESAATSGRRPTPEEFCKDTPEDLPAFVELLHQLGLAGLVTNTGKRNSDTQPAGFRAGRYMATEYHAAGGLGIVYRAKDEELNRTVALKCMKAAASANLARLGQEAINSDPAAALKHYAKALAHSPSFPPDLVETSLLLSRFGAYEAKAGDCYEMLNQPQALIEHYQRAIAHHEAIAGSSRTSRERRHFSRTTIGAWRNSGSMVSILPPRPRITKGRKVTLNK